MSGIEEKGNEGVREGGKKEKRGGGAGGQARVTPGRWNIIGTPLFCFPPENQYRRSAAPLGGEVALAGDKSQCPENPRAGAEQPP